MLIFKLLSAKTLEAVLSQILRLKEKRKALINRKKVHKVSGKGNKDSASEKLSLTMIRLKLTDSPNGAAARTCKVCVGSL